VDWWISPPSAIISDVAKVFPMDLSELLEDFRESEIYNSDPQDWMGYLKEDDYWVPDPELVY
jgi:hypothetical protein